MRSQIILGCIAEILQLTQVQGESAQIYALESICKKVALIIFRISDPYLPVGLASVTDTIK